MINGRNTAGQFTEGNSGKPKGSSNKATIAIESLLEGQAEAFLNVVKLDWVMLLMRWKRY